MLCVGAQVWGARERRGRAASALRCAVSWRALPVLTLPPPRPSRATPPAGFVSTGAVPLALAQPVPPIAGPSLPPPDGGRVPLKAKLAALLPRDTPTNPGPAVAPAVPGAPDQAPLDPPRAKTGTPLTGIPIESPAAQTAPNGDPATVKELDPPSS